MRFISIFYAIALVCVFSSTSMAQNTLEPADILAPKEKTVKKTDMSDIPDEYIIEASKFGEQCRNDSEMYNYFDCRCLAVTYLDQRRKMGKGAAPAAIRNLLGGECKDGAGIAGKMYQDCLQDFANAPKHLDPETFCGCYGRKFAKYFEQLDGAMNTGMKLALLEKARIVCEDPVTARRLYGTAQ